MNIIQLTVLVGLLVFLYGIIFNVLLTKWLIRHGKTPKYLKDLGYIAYPLVKDDEKNNRNA